MRVECLFKRFQFFFSAVLLINIIILTIHGINAHPTRPLTRGETITFVVDPAKKTFTKDKPMGCAVRFADYDVTNISRQKYR